MIVIKISIIVEIINDSDYYNGINYENNKKKWWNDWYTDIN